MKIKDKVKVVGRYEKLIGATGEVTEISGGKCLVYFKQLKENEKITDSESLHDSSKYQESKYFWIEERHLEVITEEAEETENDIKNAIFNININCKDTPCMFAFEKLRVINPERFAKEYCLKFGTGMNGVDFSKDVKEDKMEEVRVVRKLEDLDGLENGMGLVMVFDTEKVVADIEIKTLSILRVFNSEILYKVDAEIKPSLESILETAKAMGFKFEYKPLRTVEEVRTEMSLKCKEFEFNGDNYCLNYVKLYNRYHTHQECFNNILGALYFDKETADKYCNELNEILKNK